MANLKKDLEDLEAKIKSRMKMLKDNMTEYSKLGNEVAFLNSNIKWNVLNQVLYEIETCLGKNKKS